MRPPRVPGASPYPLPEPLTGLCRLALDLRWTWSHAGDALWKRVGGDLWDRTQNPWLVLQCVPLERLERLAGDAAFVRDLRAFEEAEGRYRRVNRSMGYGVLRNRSIRPF